MILTDREIQIALECQSIKIEPPPTEASYSSTSLDLTLDENLTVFKSAIPGVAMCIDTTAPGFDHEETLAGLTEQIRIDQNTGYDFVPNKLILAWTTEYIELNPQARLAARVEGKSSLARLGIGVHITAPTIHAGFKGQIRLEMMNHGILPIKLRKGMKICQLIFEQTIGTPVIGYRGRFAGQTTVRRG
jgi:dCTP deaminase